MSAPLVWIAAPIGFAGLLYLVRRWKTVTLVSGAVFAGLLALLAWQVPLGILTRIGPWNLRLETTLLIFGRRLDLVDADRPLLTLIYLGAAFWLTGVAVARAGRLAVPLGLVAVALLTAALAVEPFLFAALLIETAALVCIPILSPPGYPAGRGALRFLVFQTFGMPFILFTGYLLAGIEANPGDAVLVTRVSLLTGLGFSFMLAIFPFHSWMPIIGEEAHPYTATFVFTTLPVMVMLFGLSFLDRYAWIRQTAQIFDIMQLIGVLMIVVGGVWCAFQTHLGRMLAFTVMVETGFSLITIGMLRDDPRGLLLHFSLLPPRFLALGVWALALSILKDRQPSLKLSAIRGWAYRMPVVAAGLVLAQLSLAGLPTLAGFPVRWAIWGYLAEHTPWAALLSLLGCMGLVAACLRTLAGLLSTPATAQTLPDWMIQESWTQIAFLVVGLAVLFWMGLFPQHILSQLTSLPQVFGHLAP